MRESVERWPSGGREQLVWHDARRYDAVVVPPLAAVPSTRTPPAPASLPLAGGVRADAEALDSLTIERDALLQELQAYPLPPASPPLPGEHLGVLMPFEFRTPAGTLQLVSTTTVFGSPVDVTLQELAVESFFPADAETQRALQRLRQASAS